MERLYMVFHYIEDAQDYVDAYPVHDLGSNLSKFLPDDVPYVFITAPSRNQARKAGYQIWIEPSGKGFNKMKLYPNKEGV